MVVLAAYAAAGVIATAPTAAAAINERERRAFIALVIGSGEGPQQPNHPIGGPSSANVYECPLSGAPSNERIDRRDLRRAARDHAERQDREEEIRRVRERQRVE